MNFESGNAVICKLIRAVQQLTKSADRKLIRSNTDWTHPLLIIVTGFQSCHYPQCHDPKLTF
jgi:hypothetical protein